MNKNTRKILALSLMLMFVFMLSLSVVSAWSVSVDSDGGQKEGGVHEKMDTSHWLFGVKEFFNFGETWADVIVAAAIILIIFGATFDILNLTAFSTGWVKYVISVGVAVAFAVTGAIGAFAVGMVKITGGSVMIATFVAIFIGAGLLIMGTFMKGKLMKIKSKTDADKITAAARKTIAVDVAKIAEANAKARASDKSNL